MDDTIYQKMVDRENSFFNGEAPVLSIPAIFTYWSSRYLAPHLVSMFGTNSIEEFYANEIERVGPSGVLQVLSLGSGEASTEIAIASILRERGRQVIFHCTDISDGMNEAANLNAINSGFPNEFKFYALDINQKFPQTDAQIVIANHSLHHFVGLEFIFDKVLEQIGDSGAFIVNDMIGRNGHQRWPEVHKLVNSFWKLLPHEKRIDRIHRVPKPVFEDFDCADGTFEGIRAEDILPLCCDRFQFERFLGFGGVPDIFLDRMYGGNFDTEGEFDIAFIDALEDVNSILLMAGVIKPTAMFATMRKQARSEIFWPTKAQEAIRRP